MYDVRKRHAGSLVTVEIGAWPAEGFVPPEPPIDTRED